jgi:hypothetical protein
MLKPTGVARAAMPDPSAAASLNRRSGPTTCILWNISLRSAPAVLVRDRSSGRAGDESDNVIKAHDVGG